MYILVGIFIFVFVVGTFSFSLLEGYAIRRRVECFRGFLVSSDTWVGLVEIRVVSLIDGFADINK